MCWHPLAACDGGGRGRPRGAEQLPAPGGRVPAPAGNHPRPAGQQLQAPAAGPAGVEALPQPGAQVRPEGRVVMDVMLVAYKDTDDHNTLNSKMPSQNQGHCKYHRVTLHNQHSICNKKGAVKFYKTCHLFVCSYVHPGTY